MSNRTDKDFLYDIQEAMRRIKTYTHEITYEEFLSDTRTQDAVIRNIEIIGEATKKLSVGLRNRYPSVPWKEIARTRDRLIHHYFGVDSDNFQFNNNLPLISNFSNKFTPVSMNFSIPTPRVKVAASYRA